MRERIGLFFSSIQARIISSIAIVLALVLLVNLFVYRRSSWVVGQAGRIFVTNSSIVDLSETLKATEESLYVYLSTKTSSSLEDFYRYEQKVRDQISPLNDRNLGDPTLMLEKNIREMTESYLTAAEEAVWARRARNVEEYKESYGHASMLYSYINSFIYSLNNTRFEQNTESYQALLDSIRALERGGILTLLAAIILALFAVAFSIRETVRPLRDLARSADRVAGGDFGTEIAPSIRRDEIGTVTNAFRGMLISIREYIDRQRASMEREGRLRETQARLKESELTMEAHLKEAQLKFLQAQINPHFLFNSLNAGAQLAMMEDADRTEDFLEHMADFFRYNVQNNGGNVSLAEELQSVENYIYILNVRFAGEIHFRMRMEEKIDPSIRMPSLILQPLVENAVQHGIHDDHEKGRIDLAIDRAGAEETEIGRPCVRVTVADNGVGMTARQMKEVMTQGSGSGIALGNVASRLELYYKEKGLFSLWSDGPGNGTVVTVLLPDPAGGTLAGTEGNGAGPDAGTGEGEPGNNGQMHKEVRDDSAADCG